MTLHLAFISEVYCVVVGDRLLSEGSSTWDPKANKTVIVACEDALVAISYSGFSQMSYVSPDGQQLWMHADEWIARVLIGDVAPNAVPDVDGFGFSRINEQLRWNLNGVVRVIKAAIERDFRALHKKYKLNGLQIMFSGYSWNKVRSGELTNRWPFFLSLTYVGNFKPLSVRIIADPASQLVVAGIGRAATVALCDKLLTQISALLNDVRLEPKTVSRTIEQILAEEVRSIAKNDSTVGSELLAVDLSDPEIGYIRFLGNELGPLVAYSPWVLGGAH